MNRFLEIYRGQSYGIKGYMSVESVLANLMYTFTASFRDYNETIRNLDPILIAHPEISFIVIDSYAWYLNCMANVGPESSILRTRTISEYLNILQKIAYQFQVAVVITNSLTTVCRAGAKTTFNTHLGDHFYHRVNQRILLSKSIDGSFCATLEKSLYESSCTIAFKVICQFILFFFF